MPIEGSPQADTPAPSLRDTLSAAYEEVETAAPAETPAAMPAATEATPAPAPEPKVDALGRVHAPDGKFAPKPGETPAVAQPVAEAPLQRPSSWKKDYWGHWDKLTKGEALTRDEAIALAKYQHEREGDFAKGVSTYKQEWDRARPVLEALHPYRGMLQSSNTTPEQFISSIGSTHQVLTSGSPQEKLREIARFATAYGVPLHELFVQAEDGKMYANQTYFQPAAQPSQQTLTAEEVDKRVAAQFAQRERNQSIKSFIEAKDATGNPVHPHYEAVWKTMDGLLRSGLAQDLPTAYTVALKMPQHSELSPAPLLQQSPQNEAEKKRLAAAAAQKAKAQTVSPRNQAQTGLTTNAAASQRNGLRGDLESAFDAHLGGGGRV